MAVTDYKFILLYNFKNTFRYYTHKKYTYNNNLKYMYELHVP